MLTQVETIEREPYVEIAQTRVTPTTKQRIRKAMRLTRRTEADWLRIVIEDALTHQLEESNQAEGDK